MSTFTVIGTVTPFLHVAMQRGDKIFTESDAMVSPDTGIDSGIDTEEKCASV